MLPVKRYWPLRYTQGWVWGRGCSPVATCLAGRRVLLTERPRARKTHEISEGFLRTLREHHRDFTPSYRGLPTSSRSRLQGADTLKSDPPLHRAVASPHWVSIGLLLCRPNRAWSHCNGVMQKQPNADPVGRWDSRVTGCIAAASSPGVCSQANLG